jgi:hypothetical protein
MLNFARRVWQHRKRSAPIGGFFFDRPLVLIQSDDWGRVGVRDKEGWEELRAAGVSLGERPSDFYSLETADDVAAIIEVLRRHRDSTGRAACLVANFICANVDFRRTEESGFRKLTLLPIGNGLPESWKRPGLVEAYHAAISERVMLPALHGMTHFCRPAVERWLGDSGENGELLRSFFRAGTPYIHWRMPWVGYEYLDPESEEFLAAELQSEMISQAADAFSRFFGTRARSACAPGYRRNQETIKAWASCGVKVAQNGPGTLLPPHFQDDAVLHLYRNVQFEPALDPARYSVEACLRQAKKCVDRGLPVILSVHSINMHSSLKNLRDATLHRLDQFLSALEQQNSGLLYVNDHDLLAIVTSGSCETAHGKVSLKVTKRTVLPSAAKDKEEQPKLVGARSRFAANG